MSFSTEVAFFRGKSMATLDKVRRASILELFSMVIDRSPVDTGLFRGNWQTSVGNPVRSQTTRKDPSGDQAKAEVLANLGGLFDVVWMTNNLDYSEKLEEGYSAQAPTGVLHASTVAWSRIVAAKARAYANRR